MPFTVPGQDPIDHPGIALSVLTPREFELRSYFRYSTPTGWKRPPWMTESLFSEVAAVEADGTLVIRVPGTTVPFSGITDLASVPSLMWGLVASYGQHTQAVLLHDYLCEWANLKNKANLEKKNEAYKPKVWADRRRVADELFWVALRDPGTGDFQNPPVRSTLLWAGVSVGRLAGTRRSLLSLVFVLLCVPITWMVLWQWQAQVDPPDRPALLATLGLVAFAGVCATLHLKAVSDYKNSSIPWWVGWLPALAGLAAVIAGCFCANFGNVGIGPIWCFHYTLPLLPLAGVALLAFTWVVIAKTRPSPPSKGTADVATKESIWSKVTRTSALLALFCVVAELAWWLDRTAPTPATPAPDTRWVLAMGFSWVGALAMLSVRTHLSRDLWLPLIAVVGAPVILPVVVITLGAIVALWLPDVVLGDTGRLPIAKSVKHGPSAETVKETPRFESPHP